MTSANRESWLNQFIGRRSLSKTLQFELRPVGKTLEQIEKFGFLEKDEERVSDFEQLKELIDDYHRAFIEKALADFRTDWTALREGLEKKMEATEERDSFETAAADYRKRIADSFSAGENKEIFANLFGEKLVKELLPSFLEKNNYPEESIELVRCFKGFTTYFLGFQENRKNLYSKDREVTAIAYRLVNENFRTFVNNTNVFRKIQETAPQIITDAENELNELLTGGSVTSLREAFELDYFNKAVTQKGIDFYNQLLGGYAKEDGTKVKGLNEHVNLYIQQHKGERLVRFVPLYKQILSDRGTLSFRPEPFQTDADLLESVEKFCEETLRLNQSGSLLANAAAALKSLELCNPEKMRIRKNDLSAISHRLLKSWDRILEILKEPFEKEKDRERIEKRKAFTFREINDAITRKNSELIASGEEDLGTKSIYPFWEMEELAESVQRKFEDFKKMLNTLSGGRKLKEDSIALIKDLLDGILEFYRKIEMLLDSEDEGFIGVIAEFAGPLKNIILLYNKTRNYATRKTSDQLEKYKLTFENPQLGTGWSQSVESNKGCVIFIKDGLYYLGVFNSKNKPDFDKIQETDSADFYQKMVYQQVSDPTKDIPNLMVIEGVTVRKTGRKDSDGVNRILDSLKNQYLPVEVNRIRKSSSFKTNSDNFSKGDLTAYIEYYMQRIIEYKPEISYDFRTPAEYGSWDEFLNDIKRQSYKIVFKRIDSSVIGSLVDEGKLFLFQIYNKDFSPSSTGRPNLHTLYWKMLFDPANLNDTVIQLCGGAELFYRRGNGETAVTHPKGKILLNRQTKDGRTIPNEIYKEILDALVNGKGDTLLSQEAQELKRQAEWRNAPHDITKDKRFQKPAFKFHVPIKINFKAEGKEINNDVLSCLRTPDQDFTVLGIDRGERNLIYITLIDKNGKIILQKSLNQVEYERSDGVKNSYDYQAKLDQREKERDKSRKSWKAIGTIKELKEGYISQIVHEIAKIIVEHNAVIAMEDLNFGFKRGRFHVEKQVYQKFEKAILEKLNYLVFKDRRADEPGGVLKGYQLTNTFKSFRDMQNQSGIVFYVPAAYTSKIDPATGFINPLGRLRYESVEKSKKQIQADVKSLRFNKSEGYFEIELKDKKTGQTWTVCTAGDLRWGGYKDKNSRWVPQPVNVTEKLETLFGEYSIPYESGKDLKEKILAQSEKPFFSTLYYLLNLTLQLRYSNREAADEKDRDFILSPVKDKNGRFFDSRKADDSMPKDADANGAYHIALKGLFHIQSGKSKLEKKGFDQKWIEDRRRKLGAK